jgi:shikimate dehydrogenase
MNQKVYTLAEAPLWPELSPPARLAVLGDPIAHSKSPQMHTPALRHHGIEASYIRLHVREDEFSAAIKKCQQAGFYGVNCTIPHKLAALAIADQVTPLAKCLGVANTLIFGPQGITAHNTDGPGLLRALDESFHRDLKSQRILVLGAGGGAGRAAAIQFALHGCAHLTLTNRTLSKIESIAQEIKNYAPQQELSLLTQDEIDLRAIDLIVNATSMGMKDDDPLPGPIKHLGAQHAVYDMIYAPSETAYLAAAHAAGAQTANGLSMLLHQGAVAFESWFTHLQAPVALMSEGLHQASK